MTVHSFSTFSDHKPLALVLNLMYISVDFHKPLDEIYEKAPLRYKFNLTSDNSLKQP